MQLINTVKYLIAPGGVGVLNPDREEEAEG